MHFWIDKRSQGCGFNGRHQIPQVLLGSRGNLILSCGGSRPKQMVTPVHRFQNLESVANNGIRSSRSPVHHARYPVPCQTTLHYNSTPNIRHTGGANSTELVVGDINRIPRIHRHKLLTNKLKWGMCVIFMVVTLFLASAKLYLDDGNLNDALAYSSLIVIVVIVGGTLSILQIICYTADLAVRANRTTTELNQRIQQQEPNDSSQIQVPTTTIIPLRDPGELPPPPYHIAVMLPPQTEHPTSEIISDSPPPSYEKVVH